MKAAWQSRNHFVRFSYEPYLSYSLLIKIWKMNINANSKFTDKDQRKLARIYVMVKDLAKCKEKL